MNTTATSAPDFIDYYHLERYLFEKVSSRFSAKRTLPAFDFFCIVIWKANRAKSKVAMRLLARGHATLEQAVESLLSEVASAGSEMARLDVLCDNWRFRLPMATAILTVLYPTELTVYDVRVCDILGDFHSVNNCTNADRRWNGYVRYRSAVETTAPEGLSLRDKDRWLWAKSFATQLHSNIARVFSKETRNEENDA